MEQSDYGRFGQLLDSVGELYGKPVSEKIIPIWWASLKQFDYDAVQDAFGRFVTNSDNGQFMPKPADIIRMLQGSSVDKALQAWSKLDKAVREVGPYRDVVFDDPLIHAVIESMSGWIRFGTETDKEWDFVQNEFVTRYKGFKSRQETPQYPSVCVGIANAYNRSHGHETEHVMLLGDQSKAKQVMKLGSSGSTLQRVEFKPDEILGIDQ